MHLEHMYTSLDVYRDNREEQIHAGMKRVAAGVFITRSIFSDDDLLEEYRKAGLYKELAEKLLQLDRAK